MLLLLFGLLEVRSRQLNFSGRQISRKVDVLDALEQLLLSLRRPAVHDEHAERGLRRLSLLGGTRHDLYLHESTYNTLGANSIG